MKDKIHPIFQGGDAGKTKPGTKCLDVPAKRNRDPPRKPTVLAEPRSKKTDKKELFTN